MTSMMPLATPTLEVIELHLLGSPREQTFGFKSRGNGTWWRVIKGEDGWQFERISEDLGMRLREVYLTGGQS
jgi:hypothetical protein